MVHPAHKSASRIYYNTFNRFCNRPRRVRQKRGLTESVLRRYNSPMALMGTSNPPVASLAESFRPVKGSGARRRRIHPGARA